VRVDIVRTGGIAGIRRTSSIASDTLADHDAQELTRLVDHSRFFELPARVAHFDMGSDRFHYAITIDDGVRSHTVEVGEAAMPAKLRPLMAWLTARGQGFV
jgi:hypothetical protein